MTGDDQPVRMSVGARRAIDFLALYFSTSIWVGLFTWAIFTERHWLSIASAAGMLATFIGLGTFLVHRPGHVRGDDDPRARIVQILAITASLALASVGVTLLQQTSPDRFSAELPRVAHFIGIGCIAAAALALFIGLLVAPTSATELTRRIHLEASTTTLGFVFIAGCVYPSVAQNTGLPSLDARGVSGVILVMYVLARTALRVRYRGGAR